MSRRPQRSVVAVVSVAATKRLFVVQYKFIELYKESVLPDSCRNHDSESQESEMSECNCIFFYLKLQAYLVFLLSYQESVNDSSGILRVQSCLQIIYYFLALSERFFDIVHNTFMISHKRTNPRKHVVELQTSRTA